LFIIFKFNYKEFINYFIILEVIVLPEDRYAYVEGHMEKNNNRNQIDFNVSSSGKVSSTLKSSFGKF